MIIAICQFNPTIGAMRSNAAKLIEQCEMAASKGAKLLIAPELAICGYPPRDILFRHEFGAQVEAALLEIAKLSPIAVLLGAPIKCKQTEGEPYFNAAVLCADGKVSVVGKKTLIPNYGVFDERRYFLPCENDDCENIFTFQGIRFGISICEDAWNHEKFQPHRWYKEEPLSKLKDKGAQIIINLSASPFCVDKPRFRRKMFSKIASKLNLGLIMVGQVGANDQLIFDGSSMAINDDGMSACELPAFEEHLGFIDIDENNRIKNLKANTKLGEVQSDISQIEKALVLGVRDYFSKCRVGGAVIGISGGIDSAVVAAIAVKALGAKHVLGVRLPSKYSSDHSLSDAEALAKNLGIAIETIPIEPAVEKLRAAFRDNFCEFKDLNSISDQNLQARVRGNILMTIANNCGKLLLATGNKSEQSVGYSTIYGDTCGAISVIGDLYKFQVYALADQLNLNGEVIPKSIIEKAPSAELAPGQLDADSLPPYDQLDEILLRYIDMEQPIAKIAKKTGASLSEIERIVGLISRAEHKRAQAPFSLMVSKRVFGIGRRWPISSQYDPFLT